jgi:hypothetical protein
MYVTKRQVFLRKHELYAIKRTCYVLYPCQKKGNMDTKQDAHTCSDQSLGAALHDFTRASAHHFSLVCTFLPEPVNSEVLEVQLLLI